MDFDVVIVGGGPAGLSAALLLGRCRRRVLVLDHGRYRNAASRSLHGFLTRDGTPPRELRRIAHEELARYPSVCLRRDEAVRARRLADGFEVETKSGLRARCRKLLLATGLVDRMPDILGLRDLLGRSAFHCPYCDGWEMRDQPLVALAEGDAGARFALELTVWSGDVVLCTNGGAQPDGALRALLARRQIPVIQTKIARFEGDDGHLRVVLEDGETLVRRALFYTAGCDQGSPLAEQLGATLSQKNGVETGRLEMTDVEGLYVAGDASRDALQAIVAAGEGSKAALAINQALIREDLWR